MIDGSPAPTRARHLAFACIAAAVVGWTTWVLSRPQWQTYSYLYDDAFYYLIPAHSFAHGQGWTFDGVSATSGFHPLYAGLSAIASIFTGYSAALPVLMTLSTAAALLAAVWLFLGIAGLQHGAGRAAVAMIATLAAPKAFFQITSGLEWGWAVLATMMLVATLVRRDAHGWRIAGAAFVAVLARIDLAIFVAVFVVAMAASRHMENRKSPAAAMRLVAAGGAGAVGGVLVTLLISRLITGNWFSNALIVKESWARTNDFLPLIAWNFIMPATGPGLLFTTAGTSFSLRSVVVVGVFFLVAAWVCAGEWRMGAERRALAVASAVTIAAYAVAYARGINFIFEHYSAPIILPVAFLTCGTLAAAGRYQPAIATGLAAGLAFVCVRGPWDGIAQNGAIARDAASLRATLPAGARVGAWSAGIAGWQTGKGVINLDGLANASVADHIRSGTLACYLVTSNVTHLMDFEHMFPEGDAETVNALNQEHRRLLRLRLAYDSRALFSCVDEKAAAPRDPRTPSRYALFEIRRGCVERLCRKP